MTKRELKAYLTTLNAIRGRSRDLAVLSQVAINGNLVKATNLDVYGQLALDTSCGDGVYDPVVLKLIEEGADAGLFDQYKTNTLDDFPRVVFANASENVRVLTDYDIDAIIKASECVSDDPTRPALTHIALYEGLICGTNGYIARSARQSDSLYPNGEISILIPKMFATALKRLRGCGGTWQIATTPDADEVMLTNGTFILYGRVPDALYPDMRKLLQARTTDKAYTFPLDRVLPMCKKDMCIKINRATGDVSIAEFRSSEWRATGIVAEIEDTKREHDTQRQVIMPINDPTDIVVNASLLKRLTNGKTVSILTEGNRRDMLDVVG